MKFYQVTAKIFDDEIEFNVINKIIYANDIERAKEVFYRELDQPGSLPGLKVVVDKIKAV